MRKPWRMNGILLLIIMVGVTLLWWLDRRESLRDEAEIASQALSPVHASDTERILFQRKQEEKISLTRQEHLWTISAPVTARADQRAVKNLLRILGKSYTKKISETATHPSSFGLEPPEVTLTVHDAQQKRHTLLIGALAPVGNQRYIQIGVDGPIVTVEARHTAALLKNLLDFRDKQLVSTLQVNQITRLELTRRHEMLSLERAEQGAWRWLKPFEDSASDQRVNNWIRRIITANGARFNKQEPPEDPDWTLHLSDASGNRTSITLWRWNADLLARRAGDPDALIIARDTLDNALDQPVTELVALRPVPMEQTFTSIHIRDRHGEERAAVIDSESGKWPLPGWETVEETLTREAWRGALPEERGAPWMTITVGAIDENNTHNKQENVPTIPFWKEGKSFVLAPPKRPVQLLLTTLQADALQKAVEVLFHNSP